MKPGWRVKLSTFEKGLVVNADTEERARELALLWAKDKGLDTDTVVLSCKIMDEDDFYVAEGKMWMPGDK